METSKTVWTVIIIIASLAVVVYLFWKNQRDRKKINPDADDVVEERHRDQMRKHDRL